MEIGRNTWRAAIRLAITWSVLATAAAIVLHTLGDVSETVIVLSVIVVGFGLSWVRTGHETRRPSRRVATVPARHGHPVA